MKVRTLKEATLSRLLPGRPDEDVDWASAPWGDEPGSPAGRHRGEGLASGARRLGPVGIAAIVAGVLVVFGIGAVVISPLLFGGSTATERPGNTQPAIIGGTNLPDPSWSTEPSASAQPSQTPSANTGREENAVIALVNAERARVPRCGSLSSDGRLHNSARAHSTDMATHNFLNRQGSDGSSPQQRMRAAGFRNALGEAIASGQRTAQQVVTLWLQDRDNRSLLLNCRAQAIGVALVLRRDGTPFWTADVGR